MGDHTCYVRFLALLVLGILFTTYNLCSCMCGLYVQHDPSSPDKRTPHLRGLKIVRANDQASIDSSTKLLQNVRLFDHGL